jgi:hypothetical protein
MIGMTNEDTQESDDTWRSLGGLASGILNRILDQQVQRLAALEEVASELSRAGREPAPQKTNTHTRSLLRPKYPSCPSAPSLSAAT